MTAACECCCHSDDGVVVRCWCVVGVRCSFVRSFVLSFVRSLVRSLVMCSLFVVRCSCARRYGHSELGHCFVGPFLLWVCWFVGVLVR